MPPDKTLLVISITITSLCHIALFVTSTILLKKTSRKSFAIMAAGFGLWVLQQLVFLFASSNFLISYGKHMGNIHTLGLILLSVGFLGLLRGGLSRGIPDVSTSPKNIESEQGGAGQPPTRPESK